MLAMLAAVPFDWAAAQNLDAGKSASQIFAEVCANCHRSPREVRNNPSTSFLREHYTTGNEMASTMAAYLASAGTDPRIPGGGAQPKQKPAPAAATTAARDAPPNDAPRHPTQADPKPSAPPAVTSRPRPAPAAAEAKLPTPPAPARPVLEDFEE